MRHARRRGQRNLCEAFRFMQFLSISELTECTGTSQPARRRVEVCRMGEKWNRMHMLTWRRRYLFAIAVHRAPCANHLFWIVKETVMEDIYQHHLLPIFVHVKQHVVSES